MKKIFKTLLIIVLVFSFSTNVFAAESAETPSKVVLTDTEAAELLSNLTELDANQTIIKDNSSSDVYSTLAASSAVWQFESLAKNGLYNTGQTITVSERGQYKITAVQWADSLQLVRSPTVSYIFANPNNGSTIAEGYIFGNHTHTNTSTQVTVPQGTYRIYVYNHSSYSVSGNGNISRDL
ncbi:hypothetical protein [Paenibacillus sp. W2I17]|uniref:hypothetical protein n=1 Tax=Paenibacillus sp. W2I17 TaxID=3042311 RepID=UPI0027874068|nr:hypothetical protein [Paenibacillus sp. W2I17]MDQ0661036.1 hypothetical protein [Paenibacillus sp. W2I17]